MRHRLALVAAVVGCCAASVAFGSPTGINLHGVRYWSPEDPFVDLMKTAREWDGGPFPGVTSQGVPFLNPGQVASSIFLTDQPFRPNGTYVFLYDGDGTSPSR